MIIHIDMDAFYASVEERDNPSLKGKPVIVGGDPQKRGVVSAANYVVRQFGVHSAMPCAQAKRLCPQAIFIRPRMSYYVDISQQIREIFHRYTPLVEPLSLDEAFLDVTRSERLHGDTCMIAKKIKSDIATDLNLIASVGVAPNKFVAKIASDFDKPEGFTVVESDQLDEFLEPLPVSHIWGIGKTSQSKLGKLGIHTIADLKAQSESSLQSLFGSTSERLWELARGIDDRPVVSDREAKSFSHETTFAEDITDLNVLLTIASSLTEQVAQRLRQHQRKGRTVNVKIRFAGFHTITRSVTLDVATHSTSELWQAASKLIIHALSERKFAARLVGMGVSNIDSQDEQQMTLFQSDEKYSELDDIADQINQRFGGRAVRRGRNVGI